MWTTETRPRYNRDSLRYPSDLTDDEWGWWRRSFRPPSEVAAGDPSMFGRS